MQNKANTNSQDACIRGSFLFVFYGAPARYEYEAKRNTNGKRRLEVFTGFVGISFFVRFSKFLSVSMNVVTKEKYSIDSIQKEIKPENRIGTMEQLEQGIVAAEEMVREMERTRIRERWW